MCTLIAALTALVAISLHYYFAKQMAISASQDFAKQVASQIEFSISTLDDAATSTTSLLANYTDALDGDAIDERVDGIFKDILLENNDFYAIFYGLDNGDFYQFVNLESNTVVRSRFNAAHEDRFVKIYIHNHNGMRIKKTEFLDEKLNTRHTTTEPSDYDATNRMWYQNANHDSVYETKPYLFQHLGLTGKSYSRFVSGTQHVVAVDIALKTLSNQLTQQFSTSDDRISTQAFVFGPEGDLLISSLSSDIENAPKVSPLALSAQQRQTVKNLGTISVSNENDWAPVDFAISGEPRGYTPELINILGQKLGLKLNFINGFSWLELQTLYQNGDIDILQPIHVTLDNQSWGNYSQPLLDMPLAIATRNGEPQLDSLSDLNGKLVAIGEGWSIESILPAVYPDIEVITYPSIKDALFAVEAGEVYATIDSEIILSYTEKMYFIEGLMQHTNIDTSRMNFDTTLRLVSQNQNVVDLFDFAINNLTKQEIAYLSERWLKTSSDNTATLSTNTVPYKALIDFASELNTPTELRVENISGTEYLVFLSTTTLGRFDTNYFALMIPTKVAYEQGLSFVSKSVLITLAILVLLMPVTWFFSNPIVNSMRKLSEENRKIKSRQYDDLVHQSSFITEIDEVFSSLTNMAHSIQEHEKNQVALLDSFVKLIAQAIDDKSPYTAGHCNRVPELGLMLADVASKDNTPYFASFALDTKDKQREFKLAAWLHDCGKIITPEHIVDKGSKLECIYNRIHEVRMRFEVLWRDAQINYLQGLIANPSDVSMLDAKLQMAQKRLQEDFAFVASCNQGGEFMAEDKLARLDEIARTTWQRHFDDQLGLSPLEELNQSKTGESLPVTEHLLSDKAAHIVTRDKKVEYAPHLGIKVDVPEHKANLGELYNLKIGRGTLTAEDRFIINEHIIGTIKMLDSLPFPKELSKVPRYASTHHETLKGTGYPRRLTAKDLSIPERILVLADIFEALTASDRPYKRAKPLSVSIDILYKMSLDNHVDMEVFKLFIRSGIYKIYAERYLSPHQIDDVDESKYLESEAA
ncbi:hypothetical protein KUL49_28280 [Alteromonas sp. KUL49]|nr:hypothetical protein KUL49_28280 [Alteromonas sp. KUL49]